MRTLYVFGLLSSVVLASPELAARQESTEPCAGNTPTDRSVWCEHDINTDWHETAPDTGVTREYWLEITNSTLAPDGISRIVLAVNGTSPGPLIEANWGDNVVVHVTNQLDVNGTSIHWHGIWQKNTVDNDGTSSITECPAAPGHTKTYRWRANQYGSSWYHSHYSLQAWEGTYGPIIIHGPATANYDIDAGTIHLTDWSHQTADQLYSYAQTKFSPVLDNGLINGKNTFTSNSTGANVTTGERFEINFEAGKSYRLRLVNVAIDTYFKFSIDSHTLTVIAADFVPVKPYTTDHINLAQGQRYDVIVTADQPEGDYWMRAGIQTFCSQQANPDNVRGIIRYSSSSTSDPTSTGYTFPDECRDESITQLIPHVAHTVGADSDGTNGNITAYGVKNSAGLFKWFLAPTSMAVEWAKPTLHQIYNGVSTFEDNDAVHVVDEADQWVYYVMETDMPTPHPIHLHGHDFYILAQAEKANFTDAVPLNLDNPIRRDTVTLPASGYVVVAFLTDNPGAWLMHCHIGWHASQGMAMQFVERRAEIPALIERGFEAANETCTSWTEFAQSIGLEEEDSGI